MRSAMLAADLALVPAQPSPFDGWAAAETLRLLHEAQHFCPQLTARFVLNRCGARSLIASEIAETMAKHEPPALAARIGQRVVSRMRPAPDGLYRKCRAANEPRARSLRSPLKSSGLPDDEPRSQTRVHVAATRRGDMDSGGRPEPPEERCEGSSFHGAAYDRRYAQPPPSHQGRSIPPRNRHR